MQVDRIQVLVQQAAAGNVEAFVALVQEFAPRLRLALGAHLDQSTALIPVELAVWSVVRSRLGEWLPEMPFPQWLQQMAMEPVATHLAQADRRAIDIQDALSHQVIEHCREALTYGSELQVTELPARLAGLPEAARTLLQRRYRERQRPAALAASLMISEPELATTLAIARAACDWREIAKPPAPGDRLLPPLIEDWLNGTIDVDSRALLATNLGRDLERAAQFARQVRIHLALGAALAPFTREDAAAITRQTGLGAGDSGRVMMGEGMRPASGARSPGSEARRPARASTGNRQEVSLTDDAPRPSPLPWIIGGGMVLVGIFALVVGSMGGATRVVAPRSVDPVSPPLIVTPTSSTTTPASSDRGAPGTGGILRVDPGRTAPPPPPPRIALSGPSITGRGYIGSAFELRAELSHTYGVTAVEFWNGTERIATVTKEPFVWTWDKPEVGTASLTARALGPAGVLSTSAPAPVTLTQGYGTGSISREWWTDIGGDQLTQGYAVAGYPDRPQGADEVRTFATPRNVNDHYLQRVRGYLVPPLDGEYIFWIAGDDECELWLSEDDTRARLRRIAASPMSVAPEEWEGRPSQRSAPIVLARGRRYCVEALHKEGGGDDHLEVGWRLPDGTLERPIPGAHLALPTEPVPAGAVVASAPPPVAETPAVQAPVTVLDDARRPELMIWDGDSAKGGAGYKGFGSGGQSPLEVAPGQGRVGTGLRARLGGGNGANVGWNWHSWASDDAGTDLSGFAAMTMWVRFTGAAAPQKVVMRLSCSPREPVRRTVDIELVARQPRLMDGAWHQVVVPLAELAPQGHNFDRAKAWEVSFDISSTANMEGSFDIDEIGAVRSLVAPPSALAPTWKVVRAINLGGETTEIDGVRFIGHRQAEADGATPAGSHQPGPWLDEIAWVRVNNANGEVTKRNKNISDKPLSIDGKVYAHGLGTKAASEVIYALDGKYSGFTAVVGIDDEAEPGDAIFQVWVDGQKAFDSGAMRRGVAKPVAVPLVGRKELRLVVDPNGANDWDHADWGNAHLLVPGGNDGVLQVQAGRRATSTFAPKPAVDAKTRALLGTALGATKEGLAFRVKVPNGLSRVWVWIAENGAANSRQFDLTVEGQTLTGVGLLPANSWEKLGPIEVTVVDGTIDVAATVLKGLPQVMGILVEQAPPSDANKDTFENIPVGQKSLRAVTHEDANVPTATIRVTEDTAASGKRSLKISDAPGQPNDWDPLLYYEPKVTTGMIECRFAMRVEAGVQMVHEWRGGGADPTRPGPTLSIDGDGRLSVQAKELMRVPVGQWFTVAVTTGLGPQANGRWTLAVTLPGAKEPQRFPDLMCNGEFRTLDWVGFISYAKQTAVYYLDDVEVGPPR